MTRSGAAGRPGTSEPTPDALRVNEAAAALGPMARRLTEAGHGDAARLVEGWRGWAESPVVIAVVGEVKRGKSTLVNALVGLPVSPTGIDVVTRGEVGVSPPTDDLPDGRARLYFDDGSTRVLPRTEALDALTPSGDDGPDSVPGPGRAAGGAPSPIMAQVAARPRWLPGTALVDTPGVGGLVGEHAARARAAAERAGALLFVTDGGQVLTRPELDFLVEISVSAEYVVFALTKTDRSDGWRTVLEENRRLLREHAPRFSEAAVVPVAATLAVAAWDQDPATATMLEDASGLAQLAEALTRITEDRRRVAVAKALRIAVTAFDTALEAVVAEEAALGSQQAVRDLELEQKRLAELAQRRSYLRVYVERDLARARAEAIALMNTLIDERTADVTALAASTKGKTAVEDVTDHLRRTLREVVEEVRGRFVDGVSLAIEEAFGGLEPRTPAEFGEESATAGEPPDDDEPGSAGDRSGSALAVRTLGDLLPAASAGGTLSGAVELGRVVRARAVPKTSVLDPSMASYAFMGSHLGSIVGLAGPFAPVFAAGWVAVNLATRRSRESRQQLTVAISDSFAVLRRDLPGVLDAVVRELRPELIVDVERTLEERAREVQRALAEAKAAQQAQDRERRAIRGKVQARRQALTDLCAHAQSLLAQIAPPAAP